LELNNIKIRLKNVRINRSEIARCQKGVWQMARKRKLFAVFIAAAVLLGTMTGCAIRSKTTSSAPRDEIISTYSTKSGGDSGWKFSSGTSSADYLAENKNYNTASEAAAEEAQGIIGTGIPVVTPTGSGTDVNLDILAQRKVIRNANVSLEVDDFYAAYGTLQTMINGIGYISDSNIHREYYTFENERKSRIIGEITVRVAAKRFDSILNDIKGLGEVTDDRIYSTDITDQYFDTEARLKYLRIEYDYLVEYMSTLKEPEDIFKTRTRMTELQTEIERLTGTLNKWNNLVELSTIYIKMTEKYPEEMLGKQQNTYWDKVQNAFNRSIAGIVEALGNLLILIIEAIPVLAVIALFGWIVYIAGRRIIKKLNMKNRRKNGGETVVTGAGDNSQS